MSYPGHHIDSCARFQSDKHPGLPPDRVRINISLEHNWPGLLLVADAYQEIDAGFADDLRGRIYMLARKRFKKTGLTTVTFTGKNPAQYPVMGSMS